MPQILKTIEEYVVEDRKRDTFFMVFNTVYNDVHTLSKIPDDTKINIYKKNIQIMLQKMNFYNLCKQIFQILN